ncbi:phospholipase D1, partial [Reticulomyxa filosa]
NEDEPFGIEEVELSQEDVSTLANDSQDNGDANMDEQHMSITTTTTTTTTTRKEEKQQQQQQRRRQMKGLQTRKQTQIQMQMQTQYNKEWRHLQTTITAYAKKHKSEIEPIHKILSGEDGRWKRHLNVFDLFMCVWMTHRHELTHFAPSDRSESIKHCYNAL